MRNIIILLTSLLVISCTPSDVDFDREVASFKSTDIGRDIALGKFVPFYESYDPLIEYTEWCNSVLWPQLSESERFVDITFTREEVLFSADSKSIGRIGQLNDLVKKSGGVDALYQYLEGDAAYLMKPSRLAIPVIKQMGRKLSQNPSFEKAIDIAGKEPKKSESFESANSLCFTADLVTGMLGGESRSKLIFKDIATLVKKNTLHSRQ